MRTLLAIGSLATPGCALRAHRPDLARVPNPPVTFADVTRKAGIHFQHVTGEAGQLYYPEKFGSGCAFIDYDRDGWPDILLVNGDYWPSYRSATPSPRVGGRGATPERPTLHLYHNNHNGTFTNVTAQTGLNIEMYGMGVAVGDYDNDGYDDLYVTGLNHSILLHNEEDHRPHQAGPEIENPKSKIENRRVFRDVTATAAVSNAGHWGTSAAWLDYDRDGKLDLFVCNYVPWSAATEPPCHIGQLRIYCGPLIYRADSCRLYHNLGGGKFQDVTRAAGIYKTTGKSLGVAVWDVDEDGYPDILVANDMTPNYLFRNNGNGTFTDVAVQAGFATGVDGIVRSGMGIDIADTKDDGLCQVLISNFAREPNSFFCQEAGGRRQDARFARSPARALPRSVLFSDRTYQTGMAWPSIQPLGFGLFFFDYDNDGYKDALVVNGHIQPRIKKWEPSLAYRQEPLLFHNRGDGTFDEVHRQSGPALTTLMVGRGAAWSDFDNDGNVDVLLTENGGPAHLLRNEGGSRNGWISVRLMGRKSSRDGIGAEVRVTAAGRTHRDQVRSGSSYLSASDLRLHFGLNSARVVDTIEVRWPGGTVDRLERVPANRQITIEEGQTARR